MIFFSKTVILCFCCSLCVKGFEIPIFENVYFVNKLYIVKYVFLHRHFSYMQIFGTNLRKDIYFENEKV